MSESRPSWDELAVARSNRQDVLNLANSIFRITVGLSQMEIVPNQITKAVARNGAPHYAEVTPQNVGQVFQWGIRYYGELHPDYFPRAFYRGDLA